MSKTIAATCVAGVVTAGGVPVSEAVKLSAGVASSEGILIQDELRAYYLTNMANDLKTTIEKLIQILTQVNTALTNSAGGIAAVDAKDGPPAATTNVAAITAAVVQLTTISGDLTLYKEALA